MYNDVNKWDLLQSMSDEIATLGDRVRSQTITAALEGLAVVSLPILVGMLDLRVPNLAAYLTGCGLGGALLLSLHEIQTCLTRQLTLIRMRSVVLALPDDAHFDEQQMDIG